VDDQDIGKGSAAGSAPNMATYHLAKIESALLVRDFIDAINENFPNASYTAIMQLDQRFRAAYQSLPACLRPDLPQPFDLDMIGNKRYLVEQRVFMGITLHNRLMRLHRAYMSRGYDEPQYRYSTDCCIESAFALLDLAGQSRQGLCRWWVVVVHIWTAGLVLGSELLRGGQGTDALERRKEGVLKAISLLE
jgi:hypothetical protein